MMRVCFVLLALVLGAGAVWAQAPAGERQFVYGINAFAWTGYAGSLSARPSHAIYLLADHTSVISARETLVYYWPITGEYRADWSSLDVSIAGPLEVLQAGRVVAALQPQPYVIQYPQGPDSGPSLLYTGAEAERRYRSFVEARQRYREALARHFQERRQYLAALDRAVAARQRGERVSLPSPPTEPQPFRFFSTDVHDGFPVALPAGQYTIQQRGSDAQPVAGSRRTLVVFAHRRESVGFTIVPHARWTVPERADDPASTIYARHGQVLYFQPFNEREYNDLAYARLGNPQSREGRPDGWRWEYAQPVSAGQLLLTGSSQTETVARRPFRVVQTPGEALGYQVVEPKAGQAADFEGYQVHVRGDLRVALLDASGRRIPGSERAMRIPRSGPAWPLALIPLIPLMLGAAVAAWRREQLRRTPRPREA